MDRHFVFKAVRPIDGSLRSYLRHGDNWNVRYTPGEVIKPTQAGSLLFAFADIVSAATFAKQRLIGDLNTPAEIWLGVTVAPPLPISHVVKTISSGPHHLGSDVNYTQYWMHRAEDAVLHNAPAGNVAVRDITLIANVTDAAIALLRVMEPNLDWQSVEA